MRVAFVHDWLDTYRGGEKVLEAMLELYPEAPIYTLFYRKGLLPQSITGRDVRAHPTLNYFAKFRKLLLPILPNAIESFDLNEYDLIVSSSSCVAKGVLSAPSAKHVCYIHSPMRYIWDQRQMYLDPLPSIPGLRAAIGCVSRALRSWDVVSSNRVDCFVANSSFVRQRVQRYYDRDAHIIHPPIADFWFEGKSSADSKKAYMLVAGAFVSYKRFDLAIDACKQLGIDLVVAGSGPYEKKLRERAGERTRFVVSPSDEKLRELYSGASALIFPGVEDFGLMPVEAMACGTPVIAFGHGGALDYMTSETGCLFLEQTVASLSEALRNFRREDFSSEILARHAQRFSRKAFQDKIRQTISEEFNRT